MIIQWTNPDVEGIVRGADLRGCKVWVSFQQGKAREFDVHPPAVTVAYDGTDTTVTATLTQAQTALLKTGTVQMQVNWVTPENRRDATLVKEEEVYVNLLEREVSYADE